MASMVSLSSPLFWSQCSQRSTLRFTPRIIDGVKSAWDGRTFLVLPVRCLSSGPSQDAESEAETISSPSSSSSSPASTSTYKWCAALGGFGLVETAYVTNLKLTNSDTFCPVGSGTCGDILNSDYAIVFGVPLPLIGMVAYGLVATLGLQLTRKNLPFGLEESNGRLILLGSTTSMAAASSYFLYILGTNFQELRAHTV